MNYQAGRQGKAKIIALSVVSGIGIAVLSLIIGTILDYMIVQILSQFFISGCSEDCYFAYFNSIFYVVVLLSLVAGIVGGIRTYNRRVESS